jgi:ABC-2 type transport system permease protein
MNLAGTGSLIRLILRRDRVRLLVWVGVLALLVVGTASAFAGLYTTEAARQELALSIGSNPAMVAILGPIHDSGIGALTAWRVGSFGSVLAALMGVLTVVRHTREDEEMGRRELLGSTVVGRHAPLAASLVVAWGAGLALAVLIAAGLASLELPMSGAGAFGLAWAGIVAVFAGVGAVAAQLTEGAGAARGIAVGVIGLAFVMRVAGDGGEASGLSWLSWISPLGWFGGFRPFAGERWWMLGLWAGLALMLALGAVRLSATRDVGAGVFAPGSGPASAGAALGTPLGLSWRLHRGALLGWTAGLAVVGVVFGSLADRVGDFLTDSPQLAVILERLGGTEAIAETYFSATISILALVAAAYAIRAVLRLRVEEEQNRAESVLATATPRIRWANSHLLFGLLGPPLMLVINGLVAGSVYGLIIDDVGGQMTRAMESAIVQIPAVWVLAGVAIALFGLAPSLSSLAWGALVGCLIVGQLGQILRFPQWIVNLSPFTHIPIIPAEDLEPVPLVLLIVIALALMALGLVGFQRRDLEAT